MTRPQGVNCDIGSFEFTKYAVTYNGNGNTGGAPPTDNPHGPGETVTVLGPGSLTRTGYTFAGWNTANDGSGTTYAPGNTFTMPANDVTLYALWTINSYTVTYDGNGNTGGTAPVDPGNPHNYNSAVTVLGPGSLTRTGYTFTGWNTAANGSGTAFAPGDMFNMPAANVALYAQWTIASYTVTYDGNGNTGGSAPVDPGNPHTYNSTVTVLGPGNLTRTGYTFAGWNTAANGSGTSYVAGNTFPMPANNVTLYAQWTVNSYTVTYNGNGNSGGSAPVDAANPHNYNSTVTVLGPGTLTKAGYSFAGWNTAADGSGTSYAAGTTFNMPANNVTLYAQWAITPVPTLGTWMLGLLALLLIGMGVMQSRLG
ncbi:MAG: IPTL-CTERM sorting domain-containing protein [Acidobacteria bacterium]|nr:IPTL-CTERM sorting domain-containing protein [Acidobacteriota bacterium]